MKNLEPRVREKAIDIANALLDEGYEEGRAIAIATAKAKEWGEEHPKHPPEGRRAKLHVVPHEEGWAVKEEGGALRYQADTKLEAVDQAKEWASDANTSAIVHRKDGTVEMSHNYS